MDRKQAKTLGVKRYNTGKPCKRGHLSDRWTATCMCIECANQANVAKYWKDPKLAREKAISKYNSDYASDYYLKNKDKMNVSSSAWLAENKERKSQIDKNYRVSCRDKIKAANAKWASENPDKRMANWRNRQARVRGSEGKHTAKDVKLILDAQSHTCIYCDADLAKGYHVDHIMPLVLGGSNWHSNLQCLCPTCNLRKSGKHPDVWHNEIGYTPP